MAAISLGTVPEDFELTGIYDTPELDELPAIVYGQRATFRELIWDADGGFSVEWAGRSSVSGDAMEGYVFHLARSAFSSAGLPLYALNAADVGGGGAPTGAAGGDLGGTYPDPDVVELGGIPLDLAGPSDGDVLTYQSGELVLAPGGVGAGDVVGPASAVDDRIATFDGVTGKAIQDGGSTISGVLASAAAASEAYTDAAVAAVTGGGWVTALDTDFAAQPNATLTDGSNVIDGHTWTAVNLASGGSAVIVNGSYLRLQGNATSTTINNATRTGPHIKIALSDILPATLSLDAKLRVWLGIKVTGAAANSERSACGLYNTTHAAGAMDYVMMYRGWRSASGAVVTRPLAGRNAEGATEFLDAFYAYVANEIQVFSVNDMAQVSGFILKHATDPASAWPDARALTLQAGFNLSSSQSTGGITNPRWTSLADVCLMLGCDTGNTNNNTAFQVEVYKVKVEYLP